MIFTQKTDFNNESVQSIKENFKNLDLNKFRAATSNTSDLVSTLKEINIPVEKDAIKKGEASKEKKVEYTTQVLKFK